MREPWLRTIAYRRHEYLPIYEDDIGNSRNNISLCAERPFASRSKNTIFIASAALMHKPCYITWLKMPVRASTRHRRQNALSCLALRYRCMPLMMLMMMLEIRVRPPYRHERFDRWWSSAFRPRDDIFRVIYFAPGPSQRRAPFYAGSACQPREG